MYTDTVQRNVFADASQQSKSRGVSPGYNSQLASVIKLKDESDRDELQKYIDQFYQRSKVLSNDNQTVQNSFLTSVEQYSDSKVALN